MHSKKSFSFSAPTSTGKSFVFRHIITSSTKDIAVVVPSRALINEYYDRITELVNTKEVNVLSFVDQINTKHAKRNVFILTPERARELFKNKQWLNLEYDYLDKLIGFKLSDIFYAIFREYYEKTKDERSLKLAKYIKYGTISEDEIWLLRYGFDFEDIEWIKPCVKSIDKTEIAFNEKIEDVSEEQRAKIERFIFSE